MNKPGQAEERVAAAVLLALAAIAAGVWLVQGRLNPAVLAAIDAAATSPAAPGTARGGAGFAPLAAPSWRPISPPETFDGETLYSKIDGKADLYLAAGFKELRCQRFAPAEAPDFWVEAFVYEMASPRSAFAVYTTQQRRDAAATDLGPNAYVSENALFALHGPYYLELIASAVPGPRLAGMTAFARRFRESVPVDRDAQGEPALFPERNLVPGSLNLQVGGAFGFERLDNVFTAAYTNDAGRVLGFLTGRPSAADAQELVRAYREHLLALGGREEQPPPGLAGSIVINILDLYEVFFASGRFVAGVHEADSLAPAEQTAALLREKLGRNGGGT